MEDLIERELAIGEHYVKPYFITEVVGKKWFGFIKKLVKHKITRHSVHPFKICECHDEVFV